MKTTSKLFLMITALFLSTAFTLNAQKTNKQPCYSGESDGICKITNRIPDLTDEQKTKIEDIKLQLQKDLLPVRNSIREKEAKLITLQTVDKPDISKINDMIDEIAVLKATARKLHVKSRLDIRNLLTDKQKIWFDTHKQRNSSSNKMIHNRNTGNNMQCKEKPSQPMKKGVKNNN